jgi:hypothetical protein
MYYLLPLFIIVLLAYYYSHNIEGFNVWDYEFPLSNILVKDECPIKGTIEEIDNPSIDSCYRGYYIPYLFNVGTYTSEVQPQN